MDKADSPILRPLQSAAKAGATRDRNGIDQKGFTTFAKQISAGSYSMILNVLDIVPIAESAGHENKILLAVGGVGSCPESFVRMMATHNLSIYYSINRGLCRWAPY